MNATNGPPEKLEGLIRNLYEHILVTNIPPNAPYTAGLPREQQFALDNTGYYEWYQGLIRQVYVSPLGELWSEEGIRSQIHKLLIKLAYIKANSQSPDFSQITSDWWTKIDVVFPESNCYVPIIGLSVDEPLTVGPVTFWPLESKKQELGNESYFGLFAGLFNDRDCIAQSNAQAEMRRSVEILRTKAESALNILRYIGSLVWHGQPARHIYVAGGQRERSVHTVSIDPGGIATLFTDSTFTPIPFKIDKRIIQLADSYGLHYLQSLVDNNNALPLESCLLTAIQWYGDATQEPSPLFAFTKYYIAVETIAKRDKEAARAVLPQRLSILLEDCNEAKRQEIEKEIEAIVDERNEVFHRGRTKRLSAEYLAWACHNLAQSTINQLRLHIKSQGLETKDDLVMWIKQRMLHT